ncbi:MAG: DUF5305 domain-containing protein [Candidatus Nomurabacteria bacterium]|jgi:hypothetical protein|nr:DUF5305 domain-containing protein [Candidatus Nomurabacteria bacterium]
MKTLVEEHIKESNKDSHFIPRMIVMAVSAVVFAYAFACLILNVDVRQVGYNESGRADYEVCLIPNSYFTDACQPAGKQYVASLIDNVKSRFEYSFRADETLRYSYDYDITARLVATESGESSKVLYENEEVILPNKTVAEQTGQSLSVREDIAIDYGKYNNLITAFRSDYGLTIDSYVVVTLNVKVHASHEAFAAPLDLDEKVALKIPLSERTINVEMESDQLNNTGAMEETAPNLAKNLIYIVLAVAGLAVFVVDLVTSIIILVRRESRRSVYEKELRAIAHEYSQLIVEVEHVPEIPRSKVVEVKSFDELLDARDTIQQPILHLTVSESRSLFIIEDQGMAYVYALSDKLSARQDKSKKKAKNG